MAPLADQAPSVHAHVFHTPFACIDSVFSMLFAAVISLAIDDDDANGIA